MRKEDYTNPAIYEMHQDKVLNALVAGQPPPTLIQVPFEVAERLQTHCWCGTEWSEDGTCPRCQQD